MANATQPWGFLVERPAAWETSLNKTMRPLAGIIDDTNDRVEALEASIDKTLEVRAARVTEINERLTTLEGQVHE